MGLDPGSSLDSRVRGNDGQDACLRRNDEETDIIFGN